MSELYTFSVDLAVVEHLGLNLYSNTSAALTELIANAWDADATEVRIEISDDLSKITITDNGHGMSINDLNNKFLKVAYKKRNQSSYSLNLNRPVMGRKGIGKLSLFSIAKNIEITSKEAEEDAHSLAISVDALNESIEKNQIYHPIALSSKSFTLPHGTRFILTDLISSRINQSVSAMKKSIARRFSVIGEKDNFHVFVNDEEIKHQDRDDFRALQFAWKFKDDNDIKFPKDTKTFDFTKNHIEIDKVRYEFEGWVGTVLKPKELSSTDMGNLNGISVLSRGRIFQENILDKITENRLIKNYITGVIQADFLDDDAQVDLATSDRQRLREDDPKYIALTNFIKFLINDMYDDWSSNRRKETTKAAISSYPQLNEWLSELPTGHKKQAEELISTVSDLNIDEKNEDDRKELYRSTILAFERLKLEGNSSELSKAINAGATELIKILASYDNYEISLYSDVVKARLNTIKLLEDKIIENEYENKIRDFIFEHLWLIDPSWERVVTSQSRETAVHKLFIDNPEVKKTLSEEEQKGRLDLSYRNIGGDHIIIELKRPQLSYKLDKFELMKQGEKYRDALFKCIHHIDANFINKDRIRIVFLIGQRFEGDPKEIEKLFDGINARVSTYGEMLEKAKSAYADFLEKHKEIDKIKKLVDSFSQKT